MLLDCTNTAMVDEDTIKWLLSNDKWDDTNDPASVAASSTAEENTSESVAVWKDVNGNDLVVAYMLVSMVMVDKSTAADATVQPAE